MISVIHVVDNLFDSHVAAATHTDWSLCVSSCGPGHFDSASRSAPIASAGQCSLSGGTPSKASIRFSTVNSRHSAMVRPTTISVSMPDAIVGLAADGGTSPH